jgi:hypothetical protein
MNPIPEVLTKFDPFAMVHPKGPMDLLALMREVNRELDNLNGHLRTAYKQCEANRKNK